MRRRLVSLGRKPYRLRPPLQVGGTLADYRLIGEQWNFHSQTPLHSQAQRTCPLKGFIISEIDVANRTAKIGIPSLSRTLRGLTPVFCSIDECVGESRRDGEVCGFFFVGLTILAYRPHITKLIIT